jgi:predicted pyridoxine 5'-phosphate oxidase superfamily flavin-nucleotide-binding protein
MQSDDINKRKIITSVEIVDIPTPIDKEAPFKADDEPAGTTKLSKEELQLLFQGRNLAFIATLSKDGSPHVTPVWAELVDDLILINTFESSAKNKHITKDNRIALAIVE